MLQSQFQNSEALLQDLQKSFSLSQNAVQSRLVSAVTVIVLEILERKQLFPNQSNIN